MKGTYTLIFSSFTASDLQNLRTQYQNIIQMPFLVNIQHRPWTPKPCCTRFLTEY